MLVFRTRKGSGWQRRGRRCFIILALTRFESVITLQVVWKYLSFLTLLEICPSELGKRHFGVFIVCCNGFFEVFFDALPSALLGSLIRSETTIYSRWQA
jgi:hypothetical protein